MEELKYKIAFETDKVEASELVDPSAISALVELQNQIKSYQQELKALDKAEKENKITSQEAAEQKEKIKINIKQTQNEYAKINREIQNNTKAANENKNSYQGLVEENKRLMNAMRSLPLDDTTGELQKLQTQYNANNEQLKKFDATIGNHQRNVGNYKGALGDLGNSLSSIPGPIGGAVGAVKTFNTVLKANPIGLVVTAIGLLVAAFSKFQPVIDFATKSFEVLSNTFTFFVEKAGSFFGLIEPSNVSLSETISKTAELADAQVRLRDAKREEIVMDAEQNKLISELRLQEADRSKTQEERIAILQKIEQVEKQSLDRKIKLAKEELRIAQERAAINHSDAATLEDIANKRAALIKLETDSNNFLREQITKRTELEKAAEAEKERKAEEAKRKNEEAARKRKAKQDQEAARLKAIADERLKNEQRIAEEIELIFLDEFDKRRILVEREFQQNVRMFKEGEDAYVNAEKIKNAKLEQILKDRNQIEIDKSKELQKKLADLDQLFQDTTLQNYIDNLRSRNDLVLAVEKEKEVRLQILQKMFQDAGLDAYKAFLRAQEQADAEFRGKLADARKQEAENEKKTAEETEEAKRERITGTLDLIQFAATSAISIGKNIFGESKALAVAQAIIDSLGAAVGVMRDTKGSIFVRLANAAVILSAGYANVKKIISTKPGKGGGGGTSASSAVAAAGTAVSATTLTNPERLSGQSTFATGIASSVGDPNMIRRDISIQANVDRRGLAIAVREGERDIRTQQFDYR
jgi:hypothetical protein